MQLYHLVVFGFCNTSYSWTFTSSILYLEAFGPLQTSTEKTERAEEETQRVYCYWGLSVVWFGDLIVLSSFNY